MIKTRFAPSPTGFLHIGGLRTALFAYLFAKKNNGNFLLRIEDTDRERFVKGGIENIIDALSWGGITVDGGVVIDKNGAVAQVGDNGPYIQSERLDIYKEYVEKLIDDGHAYYCFCSKEKLEEVRKEQEANKQPTLYDGTCRNMPSDEVKILLDEERDHVVRMKMPQEGITKFNDLIRGDVEFKNALIDDQVLLKSDGFPTYHLANVIDDHLMEITHVIRGEEWLPSVPKHFELYKMFGWEAPEFAHLSLLVNEQKQKLSKRHGDVSVEDFKEKGYLPEAMINFIAFLGWNPGDEREIFSLSELEKEFSLEKVGKSAAVFNREKLDWYNREYMRSMSCSELTRRAIPFFVNAGLIDHVSHNMYHVSNANENARNNKSELDNEWLQRVVALEKERASTLVELVDSVVFIFANSLEYEPELLVWKKSTKEDAREKLNKLHKLLIEIDTNDWTKEGIEERVMAWIEKNEYRNGDVLWPMRVALSGKKNSPGPFEIAGVLGNSKTLNRINIAIDKL